MADLTPAVAQRPWARERNPRSSLLGFAVAQAHEVYPDRVASNWGCPCSGAVRAGLAVRGNWPNIGVASPGVAPSAFRGHALPTTRALPATTGDNGGARWGVAAVVIPFGLSLGIVKAVGEGSSARSAAARNATADRLEESRARPAGTENQGSMCHLQDSGRTRLILAEPNARARARLVTGTRPLLPRRDVPRVPSLVPGRQSPNPRRLGMKMPPAPLGRPAGVVDLRELFDEGTVSRTRPGCPHGFGRSVVG
jgi:hypothetical protein